VAKRVSTVREAVKAGEFAAHPHYTAATATSRGALPGARRGFEAAHARRWPAYFARCAVHHGLKGSQCSYGDECRFVHDEFDVKVEDVGGLEAGGGGSA
jgi:hypothetical protein